MDNIRKFYSPLFTEEALTYRKSKELGHKDQPFPIIVQLMVFSKGGGKITTLNPTDGNRDQIDIKAIYGLGELIKQDGITPDSYLVDKTTMNIIGKEVSPQTVMLARASEGGTEELPVMEDGDKPVLSDVEIVELAEHGNAVQTHFRKPMSVEWALDERDSKLWILQAEPETVWTDKVVEGTEEEITDIPEKPNFTCPLCDEPVEETAKTCESCGAEFDEPVKAEEGVEEEIADGAEEEKEEIGEEEGMAPPPEEISMEEAEDIDLGALMGDESMGEFNLDLESLNEDVSISALDKMVSNLLGDEGEEPGEMLEIPDMPDDEMADELSGLDLDEIEIEGETDLDIDLDDISIEDLEKSLDELGE